MAVVHGMEMIKDLSYRVHPSSTVHQHVAKRTQRSMMDDAVWRNSPDNRSSLPLKLHQSSASSSTSNIVSINKSSKGREELVVI